LQQVLQRFATKLAEENFRRKLPEEHCDTDPSPEETCALLCWDFLFVLCGGDEERFAVGFFSEIFVISLVFTVVTKLLYRTAPPARRRLAAYI